MGAKNSQAAFDLSTVDRKPSFDRPWNACEGGFSYEAEDESRVFLYEEFFDFIGDMHPWSSEHSVEKHASVSAFSEHRD